jgi:hypothetical protein
VRLAEFVLLNLEAVGAVQLQRSSLKRNEVKDPAWLLFGLDLPQFPQSTASSGLLTARGLPREHWQKLC